MKIKGITKDITKEIGSLIREMRKEAGLSQMKLAAKIGISYQQVQKYEKGASKLSVPRLIQLAEIFSVPVTHLLEEPSKAAKMSVSSSSLSEDEAILLLHFRRLGRKKLKRGFVEMLNNIVKLSETK